ncbi:sensor histidine kinase [Streptomyces sp. NPDC088251]|uniref:sensor histidine kinase n=1 Tax=unclassified Streptomyces TaxID=2593676 RepID=UPI0033E277FF
MRTALIRSPRPWLHAVAGALLSLPPALAAALAAPPGRPLPLRVAASAVALLAALTAMGFPRAARTGSVRLANALLGGTELPAPAPGTSRDHRLRTTAWLVPHIVVGVAVTTVTFLLLLSAAVFPGVWLTGGGHVSTFGTTVPVGAGWRGAWTPLVSVVTLAAAAYVALGGAAVLRPLAPVLLDHRPAERLAAAEEELNRLAGQQRLARELHDSIGHTLTASTIQAAVAGELLDRDPEAARRALTSIEETTRAALDDLDHVLGLLRAGDTPTAPPRTLADLGPLTDRVRQAGAGLRVKTHGDLTRVPATVSRETYRIVQEGLTNALRHGDPSSITLQVTAGDDWLDVELLNLPSEVRTSRRRQAGQGLDGIRERVRTLRGETSAGPSYDAEDGRERWRLTARLPLRSAA